MACNGCKSDPRPANYGSDRECAFLYDGTFTKHNWNCVMMNALHALLPPNDGDSTYSSFKTRDDSSAASFGVFRIPECAEDFMKSPDEELGLSGYVASTWYKNRGATGSCMIMCDDDAPRAITLNEAEAIVTGAKAQTKREDRLAAERDALAAKNREIRSTHTTDPIVRAWMEAKTLMSVDSADVANGLAHLASRIPYLKKPLTVELALKIMEDQFDKRSPLKRFMANTTSQ